MGKATSYGTTPQSVCGPDGSQPNWMVNTSYDNAEFTVATGLSDYDVGTNESSAFSNIAIARFVEIRTDQTITVKCNATGNASITITSSDSPYKMNTLEVTNIYVTNASGSAASVKLFLT